MKKIIYFAVIFILSGVLVTSCKKSDEKLQKQVETVISAVKPGISSIVKDGVVTLTGTVDSEEAKAALETAAKAVKDIKSVTNNITVELPKPAVVINPDDVLSSTIATALTTAQFKDIVPTVKEGVVTLTGTVKRADLKKIMQIVNEAKPAKVVNELTIK